MLSLLVLTIALQGLRRPDPPPGLVSVPGGRTAIGIEVKDLERLLAADRNSQGYAGALSAETPRHEAFVAPFDLMVTEVTNEQYAAYVEASGARPPEHWADPAIRAAAEGFLAEVERQNADALERGLPVPEPATFDRQAWWREGWRGAAWAIPAGLERMPVVYVDYDDARRYARWAGLRLPTELEHQRAVRGESTRMYPWGNDWDSERYAATSLQKKKASLRPVGSFPAGASRQGVFDLAGNVWEWTSSAYLPFPGYEPRIYEFGYGSKARSVHAMADWNAGQRVVVGGSFQNGSLLARATTRRASDRGQSADALGFRCAATPRAGVDVANAILEDELGPNVRPLEDGTTVVFAPEESLAWQRWEAAPPDPEEPAPPGYAVITGHEFVAWTPVRVLRGTEITSFERQSIQEGPVVIGFLACNVPLAEPALAPGTYLVHYRASGTPRFPTGRRGNGPSLEELFELDVAFDHLLFVDLTGKPAAALRLRVEYGNLREGRISGDEERGMLRLEPCIPSRTKQKGFTFALDLVLAAR